jgi:sulfoxide reductase heme-binding subunit YedZ
LIASTVSASKAVWYLTRGTGAVALVLLTATTALGVTNSVRWSPPRTPRFVLQHLHRNVSLLSVAFIAVHVATAVIDGFAPIRWLDAVVPFGSAYRPFWLGLGAVAFDVLIAIAVTSLIRARLGYRTWRAVHWTAYGCWSVAIFHGMGVGSDTRQPWMLALVAASVAAVGAATLWRLVAGWPAWAPSRVIMLAGLVTVPAAIGLWALAGPLQPGWAPRAGTPASLLRTVTTASSGSPVTVPAAPPLVLPSDGTVQGTTKLHRLSGGQAKVVVSIASMGTPKLEIMVVLKGQALSQGVSMTSSSVTLAPPQGAAVYRGNVTGLSGGNVSASLSDGHGDEIQLILALQIDSLGATSGRMAIQTIATAQVA